MGCRLVTPSPRAKAQPWGVSWGQGLGEGLRVLPGLEEAAWWDQCP